MDDTFLVRFWGVRGSYPVPGTDTVRYGGNTPCVEVRVGEHTIILDAGTGLIHLGKEMVRQSVAQGEPIRATFLFSHIHHDHTQGLPYFDPAYIGTSTLYFFGPRSAHEQLAAALRKIMLPPHFPVQWEDLASTKVVREISERERLYLWPGNPEPTVRDTPMDGEPEKGGNRIRIDVLKSYAHPQEGVFFYRISYKGRSLVYASDTEGYVGGDQRLTSFARGADLLIHDAHYTTTEYLDSGRPKQGWGHSTPEMAVAVARAAGVKRLALFHLNPLHADELLESVERRTQEAFESAVVAREGICVNLLEEPSQLARVW